MDTHSLHESCQSAYRTKHSTETALVKIQNDLLCSVDRQKCVLLVLLDMSAAFDTVKHSILLSRLEARFGITGSALQWLGTYFMNRHQCVSVNGTLSDSVLLTCGMPQGSLIGPSGYPPYVSPLFDIAHEHGVVIHMYADDTQLYLEFDVCDWLAAKSRMENCIADMRIWLSQNCLKLNDSKTELLVIGQSHTLKQLHDPLTITIGDHFVQSSKSARNIGAILDNELRMVEQVNSISRSCYASLYSLARVRKYLTEDAVKTLVHAFVTNRLDNFNSLLTGLPSCIINRLQLIQNSAARLITRTKKHDHITGVLQALHWLPVEARIQYKILLLTYKALNGLAPLYLEELLVYKNNSRSLRSSDEKLLEVPKSRLRTVGDRSFSFAAAKSWNELPKNIRLCTSVASFKNSLKTHLFKKHFKLT